MQPEVFGDFLLVQPLAVSHMAEAFIAVRLGDKSGRTFVIKRPRIGEAPSGRAARAIAREADVLGQVRGHAIVRLASSGEIAGLPYVAVEHVRGAALDWILEQHGALPLGAAAALARDLALALATVHEAGFTHGDVAPSNVLVDETGEAQLVDFGLAMTLGDKRHELSGKPGYIAPEALHDETADASSDIYGWGVVITECLLGRRLFAERDLADAGARSHPPPALSKLQDASWVERALARDPAARPSARELAASIDPSLVDRAALSELITHATSRSDGRVTQVAPPQPASVEPERLLPTSTAPAVSATEAQAPSPQGPARRNVLAYVSVGLVAGLVGMAVGRRSSQQTQGRLTIAGWLPPRATIEIDGKAVERTANGEYPLAPGDHVLQVHLKNRQLREVPFTVRAGENVVIVPLDVRK